MKDPDALKVRDWRHKLQKAFLGKTVPKDEVSKTFPIVSKSLSLKITSLSWIFAIFMTIGHASPRQSLYNGRKVREHEHWLPLSKFCYHSRGCFPFRWQVIIGSRAETSVCVPTTNAHDSQACQPCHIHPSKNDSLIHNFSPL